MSKLLISTQVYENYAWQEDGSIGTGDNAYWKAKGGNDYVYPLGPYGRSADALAELLAVLSYKINRSDDYYQEMVIAHSVVADDYLTEFERDQLAYEGKITYPAVAISI